MGPRRTGSGTVYAAPLPVYLIGGRKRTGLGVPVAWIVVYTVNFTKVCAECEQFVNFLSIRRKNFLVRAKLAEEPRKRQIQPIPGLFIFSGP